MKYFLENSKALMICKRYIKHYISVKKIFTLSMATCRTKCKQMFMTDPILLVRKKTLFSMSLSWKCWELWVFLMHDSLYLNWFANEIFFNNNCAKCILAREFLIIYVLKFHFFLNFLHIYQASLQYGGPVYSLTLFTFLNFTI